MRNFSKLHGRLGHKYLTQTVPNCTGCYLGPGMKIFYQLAVMLLELSFLFLPRHFAVFDGRGELGRVSNKK